MPGYTNGPWVAHDGKVYKADTRPNSTGYSGEPHDTPLAQPYPGLYQTDRERLAYFIAALPEMVTALRAFMRCRARDGNHRTPTDADFERAAGVFIKARLQI